MTIQRQEKNINKKDRNLPQKKGIRDFGRAALLSGLMAVTGACGAVDKKEAHTSGSYEKENAVGMVEGSTSADVPYPSNIVGETYEGLMEKGVPKQVGDYRFTYIGQTEKYAGNHTRIEVTVEDLTNNSKWNESVIIGVTTFRHGKEIEISNQGSEPQKALVRIDVRG